MLWLLRIHMPIVADFQEIVGDSPQRIGDDEFRVWEAEFPTRGRIDVGGQRSRGNVFLIFEVQGLTATIQDVVVSVNGRDVGRIHPYEDSHVNIHTQMISFPPEVLDDGDNIIQVQAVGFQNSSPGNLFDDFAITNMVIFYHRAA